MLSVSERAAEVLNEALRESGVRSETGLRLSLDGTRWMLSLDTPEAGDRVIRYGGSVLLIVGPLIDWIVQDGLVDIAGTAGGMDLVLRRRRPVGAAPLYGLFSAS